MDSVDCRNNRLHDGVTSLSTPGHTAPLSIPRRHALQTASWRNCRSWQDQQGSIVRCGTVQTTSTKHPSPSSLPPTPPCSWPLGCSQGRVRLHVAGRYRPTCRGNLVIRPPSRAQEGPVGGRVEITDPWTIALFPTDTQSHTYGTTLTTFPFAPFSKIDITRAYQIPVHPDYIQKTNYHTFLPYWISLHVHWPEKRCPNLL